MLSPEFAKHITFHPLTEGYFLRAKFFKNFVKWRIQDLRCKRGLPFDSNVREECITVLMEMSKNIIRGAIKKINFGMCTFPTLSMELDDVYAEVQCHLFKSVFPKFDAKKAVNLNKNSFFSFIQKGVVFRILYLRKKSKRKAELIKFTPFEEEFHSEGEDQLLRGKSNVGENYNKTINSRVDQSFYQNQYNRIDMVDSSHSIMNSFTRFRDNFTRNERRVIDYIVSTNDLMILHSSRSRDFRSRFHVSSEFKRLFIAKIRRLVEKDQ